MKALRIKKYWLLATLLVLLFGAINTVEAQNNNSKKVTITITTTDEDGNKTIEKIEKEGAEASEQAIDKIVQDALKSSKSIEVEVEQTQELDGGKGITKTIEKHANREVEEGEMEIEIALDEDGNIITETIKGKEVKVIHADSDEEVTKLLEEHGIDIDKLLEKEGIENGEGTTKEVRIIKMRVDEEKEIDVDQLLKDQGIEIEEAEGIQKRVRVIKKEKAAKGAGAKERGTRIIKKSKGGKEELHEEHTVIQIGDAAEEEVIIFQGEDGARKVIKKRKEKKINWTEREDVEEKIKKMGIVLPTPTPPAANYVNAVRSDKLIFMAGKGPSKPEGGYITGKVGRDLTEKEGYAAARLVGIAQLAALKAEIGDLNKVKRIVKVLGMVNATSDFTNHPEVVNGFSDLMVEAFGERGKHARAAVGMYSLPRNIAVEVEMVVEIE